MLVSKGTRLPVLDLVKVGTPLPDLDLVKVRSELLIVPFAVTSSRKFTAVTAVPDCDFTWLTSLALTTLVTSAVADKQIDRDRNIAGISALMYVEKCNRDHLSVGNISKRNSHDCSVHSYYAAISHSISPNVTCP